MKVINLDCRTWQTPLDFYEAMLKALQAPAWHGQSVAALCDSMIGGGINGLEPPYVIRIRGIGSLPSDVREHVERLARTLTKDWRTHRRWYRKTVDAYLELRP